MVRWALSRLVNPLLTLRPVLDGGTGFLKAGYAGQNFPDHQYPSIVGRPILRTEEQNGGDIQLKDVMCGDEAAAARSMLQITYPVRDCLGPVEGSLGMR